MEGSLVLSRIEEALFDGTPVEDILRMIVILGGNVGSDELVSWASGELEGYRGDAVPEYRCVYLPLFLKVSIGNTLLTGIQTHHELYNLGYLEGVIGKEQADKVVARYADGVPIGDPLAKLNNIMQENVGNQGNVQFSLPESPYIVQAINAMSGSEVSLAQELYWSVDSSTIAGIIDQVKTTVARFLATVRSSQPEGQNDPTNEAIRDAANTTIIFNGPVNNSSIVGQVKELTSIIVNCGDFASLANALQSIGVDETLIAKLQQEIPSMEKEVRRTKRLDRLKPWIKDAARTIRDMASNISTTLITDALKQFFGL